MWVQQSNSFRIPFPSSTSATQLLTSPQTDQKVLIQTEADYARACPERTAGLFRAQSRNMLAADWLWSGSGESGNQPAGGGENRSPFDD